MVFKESFLETIYLEIPELVFDSFVFYFCFQLPVPAIDISHNFP